MAGCPKIIIVEGDLYGQLKGLGGMIMINKMIIKIVISLYVVSYTYLQSGGNSASITDMPVDIHILSNV